MKDCPRCGSSLSHYALADGEAYGCDACGWVGVDVEHRSKPATLESWHDAISRFESKFARDGSENAVRNLERVRDNVTIPDDAPETDPKPHVERVPSDTPSDADVDVDEPDAAAEDDASPTSDPDETPSSADQDEGTDEDESAAADDDADDRPTDDTEPRSTDDDTDPDADSVDEDATAEAA